MPAAMSHSQTLGAGDALGAGDSYLTLDVVPPELAEVAYERLRAEVKWDVMHHRGGEVPRLVAVEGEVAPDGSFPIYRHPADESPPLHPFSLTVEAIRQHVQNVVQHPVNHVLIQLYRTGADYISDHSDKTIDVVRGSNIVNVSIGAQRTMTLRSKIQKERVSEKDDALHANVSSGSKPPISGHVQAPPRPTQRIPLPHNSMFVMGPATNAKWLHGIPTDKRPLHLKSPPERVQDGERISLTFRYIGTFLSADGTRIWGQGARGKTQAEVGLVVHGERESAELLVAFGKENQMSEFDWEGCYGMGFDVVNFTTKEEQQE